MRKIARFVRDNIRAVVIVALVILVMLLMVGGVFVWEKYNDSVDTPSDNGGTPQNGAVEYINGVAYKQKSNMETVLIMGVDKYEDEVSSSYINNQLADFIMLLVLDHDAQSYTLVPINRDTLTQIETIGVMGDDAGTITAQIALAHAYGTGGSDSSRNVTKAASNLLYGVPVEHYTTLKLDAVSVLNDTVGGVEVELLDDFTALDPLFTKGSVVTLHGEQATTYIRARGELENSTNISRMERQQQYMTAWLEAYDARCAEDEAFPLTVLTAVSNHLITDLTNNQMEELVEYYETYTSHGIKTIVGESVKGEEYMEFHVDEASLRDLVVELFYIPAE